MKTLQLITIIALLFVSLYSANAQLYNPYGNTCEEVQNPPQYYPNILAGQYKPERCDYPGTPSEAYFPILVLFVQFANDSGPNVDYWPVGQNPTFYKDVISNQKRTSTNWWDAYSQSSETLSDFWMEASRGHFHAVGRAFSIILPHSNDWYKRYFGTNSIYRINDDIYNILQTDYQDSIYWPDYDKWQGSGGNFTYGDGDGYVDMIYKVFRSHNPGLGMPAGGIAYLYDSYSQGSNYLIYSQGGTNIYINGGYSSIGSGLTITPGHGGEEGQSNYGRYNPINKLGTVSFSEHEHGHYLFGNGHQRYGKMMGSGNEYGLDEFLSPYEELQMGYLTSNIIDFSTVSHQLYDYSSRNSSNQGEVFEVPINGSSEFFLIANRTKVSYYDKLMFGDTCHDDPYRNVNQEYGKGLYIYHAYPNSSGYPWQANMDNECADGLFNWTYMGTQHPDWSNDQDVGYYKNTSVAHNNDNGGDYLLTINNHDGISIDSWFSIGKRHVNLYEDGTDRIYTNLEEVWTSRSNKGDRWDGWRIGYNQVFSPYSSPSTVNWSSSATGIFIYLESTNGSTANLKIYKAGEGGWTEEEILEATPPSRPMGLTITMTECIDQKSFPVLTWKANLEPDMDQYNPPASLQRFKIYRATSDIGDVPTDFVEIADQNFSVLSDPSFIDYDAYAQCDGIGIATYDYMLRYRVKAVDFYNSVSVFSDFAAVPVYLWQKPGGDNFTLNNENNEPVKFSLSQNYPNPFNPSTEIRFTIPKDMNVKLKVYSITGEEVVILVNEFKSAGNYSVKFDGSNLASGIYIYKIEAGSFVQSKKMVLIK